MLRLNLIFQIFLMESPMHLELMLIMELMQYLNRRQPYLRNLQQRRDSRHEALRSRDGVLFNRRHPQDFRDQRQLSQGC